MCCLHSLVLFSSSHQEWLLLSSAGSCILSYPHGGFRCWWRQWLQTLCQYVHKQGKWPSPSPSLAVELWQSTRHS